MKLKRLFSLLILIPAVLSISFIAPGLPDTLPQHEWGGVLLNGITYTIDEHVQVNESLTIPENTTLRVMNGGSLSFVRGAKISVYGKLAINSGGRIFNSGTVTLMPSSKHERLIASENAFINTRSGELVDNSGTIDRFLFTAAAISREPLVFKRGIDVSRWQGDIDWQLVSETGIDFAMLRIGRGTLIYNDELLFEDGFDSRFHEYIEGAQANGIDVGVYWYSYARTIEEIQREARFLVDILGDFEITYPVVLDMEEIDRAWYIDCPSEMAEAFLEIIIDAGYFPMFYSFMWWLEDRLTPRVRDRFTIWVAHYEVRQTTFSGNYYMWQYTHYGRVSGIQGDADLNIGYRDFASFIRRHGLNNLEPIRPPR
ncbi:MAG: glycoside hydrolase family 25 protein [Oscillospiraceae bacterium]|nr:glycoside hydrolase family 25 protein [Oscillospiraceae bacterium]